MPLSQSQKLLLFIGIAMLISACATEETEFYRHQPSMQPLEIPPDLTLLDVNSGFEIPQIAEAQTKKVQLSNGADVILHKDGRLRWLSIEAGPKDIWDETKEFWVAYKVELNWESLKLGIMETKWISSYESEYAQDRFRVRLEPSDKAGYTDLYVSHRGRQEKGIILDRTTSFSDPELEIEVMGELLSYFGLSHDRKMAILDDAKLKPDLTKLNLKAEVPYLVMGEPFNRSWRFVSQSIDRMGHIVTQRDKKAGWLDIRLEEDSTTSDFTPGFTLSDHSREIVRLQIKTEGKETKVIMLTDEGQPDRSELAKDFLQELYDNL